MPTHWQHVSSKRTRNRHEPRAQTGLGWKSSKNWFQRQSLVAKAEFRLDLIRILGLVALRKQVLGGWERSDYSDGMSSVDESPIHRSWIKRGNQEDRYEQVSSMKSVCSRGANSSFGSWAKLLTIQGSWPELRSRDQDWSPVLWPSPKQGDCWTELTQDKS